MLNSLPHNPFWAGLLKEFLELHTSSPLSPLPLKVGPSIAARGSGEALKFRKRRLPQWVWAEPSRQTHFLTQVSALENASGDIFGSKLMLLV